MKSILFVINTLGVGGGEKALLEVLSKLIQRNMKCLYLYLQDKVN